MSSFWSFFWTWIIKEDEMLLGHCMDSQLNVRDGTIADCDMIVVYVSVCVTMSPQKISIISLSFTLSIL
jgi:hypothetical protein